MTKKEAREKARAWLASRDNFTAYPYENYGWDESDAAALAALLLDVAATQRERDAAVCESLRVIVDGVAKPAKKWHCAAAIRGES